MKSICVIGSGYVGLVTATCFADLGNYVVTVDIDTKKIDKLKQGIMPIYEPGLEELVERSVKAGRLHFSTSYAEGLDKAQFVFICVGTPSAVDGEADLKYVRAAAQSIAENMKHPLIIINKSTVPVGTGDWTYEIVQKSQPTPIEFSVVSCPEFLREGSAIGDFMNPDRTVLGSTHHAAAEKVAELYEPLKAPIVITDIRTAEMIKYASNAFLATRISFINEISIICERLGADVTEVARGMGYDKRIGPHFLQAGVGYGGSCFAADETLFTLNSPNVIAERIEDVFNKTSGDTIRGDIVEVKIPADKHVLGFDLSTGKSVITKVNALTRRPYQGTMVTIKTGMGREMRVTADHPVLLYEPSAFNIIPAIDIAPGDQIATYPELFDVRTVDAQQFMDCSEYAVFTVKNVEYMPVSTTVYSLETEHGTVIISHGNIVHNCFPKDVKALANMALTHGMHPQLLSAVMEINDFQRKQIVLKVRDLLGGTLEGKVIGVLGLAFKPNTDDVRDAPALTVIRSLMNQGGKVKAYDPVAMETASAELKGMTLCENPYEVAENVDALVIMTEWNEFKQLDMQRVRASMKLPILVDGRNIYDPKTMHDLGFIYRGVGRGYNGEGRSE